MIMTENKYKVLITTSGIGQRLGELTRYTNKSLVRVGKKPVLSYIIESYPKDVPLVVTVGYFADQVKDFISLAYPERSVEFINIDKYQGEGSSLGYSMLQAKNHLQCPFIYHACDTIVTDKIPTPDKNWIGGYKGNDTSQYASWKIINDNLLSFNDKGALDFDFIHIGLVGIKDYKIYWKNLEKIYKYNTNNSELNDCMVLVKMIENKKNIEIINFSTWFDIGNTNALNRAKKEIGDHFDNLDKNEESIFLFDNFVIKFFNDEKIVKERIERASILSNLVPNIDGKAKNFYRYKYIKGELYSEVVNPTDFSIFLKWSQKNLWTKTKKVSNKKFKNTCRKFYHDKTIERIQKFLKDNAMEDEKHTINGEMVPKIEHILKEIDFNWLSETSQSNFHGDFILDNIIKTKKGYRLIDWRNNFGGLLYSGDIYYDLAKLNHNLIVNHDIINKNLFSVKNVKKNVIICDIMRKENLVACQSVLSKFLLENNYNSDKIKILTAIIWLNMSPLHHHPFNLFLYYFGKLNLWRAIKENK